MTRNQLCVVASASIFLLVGCTSISGLSGGSGYACKAPEGVACDSVSGTYANSVADRLPNRRTSTGAALSPLPETIPAPSARPATALRLPELPNAAASLRSSPRILRLWVKPWEDADGDLIDQSYVYVQVDNGQWLIEHAQRQIREAYAPVKPPPRLLNPSTGQDAKLGSTRSQTLMPSRPGLDSGSPASPILPATSD